MVNETSTGFGLDIDKRFVHRVDRRTRNPLQKRLKRRAAPSCNGGLDDRFNRFSLVDSSAVLPPTVRDVKVERLHERVPLVFGAHADGKPPVAGLERSVRDEVGMGAAHAAGRDAGQGVVPLIDQRGQSGVPEGDVNSRAFAGLFPVVQGGKNRTDGVHSGHDVDPGNADFCRPTVGVAGDGHDAAACLHREVKRHFVPPRSALAVAGNAAKNGLRVNRSEESVKGARPEVLDDDIGLGDEFTDTFPLDFDVAVQHGLAPVAGEVVRRDVFSCESGLKRRTPTASIVAPRGFDLGHLGPQISEGLGGVWTGQNAREVKHLDAGERLHGVASATHQFNLCSAEQEQGACADLRFKRSCRLGPEREWLVQQP